MKTIESENIAIFKGLGKYIDYIRPHALSSGGFPFKTMSFEFKVRTITGMDRNRREHWVESVLVRIDFKEISENVPPSIIFLQEKSSEIPFHPNIAKVSVMLQGSYGEWLYPLEWWQQMDSMALIIRLYDALRYEKSNIITDQPQLIGNQDARKWYDQRLNENMLFPTGPFVTDIKVPVEQDHTNIPLEITNDPTLKEIIERQPEIYLPSSSPATQPHKLTIQPPEKKKFEIKVRTVGYQPIDRSKPKFVIADNLLSKIKNPNNINNFELYITTTAQQIIFDHLAWGRQDVRHNKFEQGGILLGDVFRDPITNSYYGLVENIIPSETSSSSPTHLSMGHEQWARLLAQIEAQSNHRQIIGWYHTHPNQLDVYLSETDLLTQRTHFQHDWHFAAVLNPHQQVWRVFQGKNGVECRGYFLKEDQTRDVTENLTHEQNHFSGNNSLVEPQDQAKSDITDIGSENLPNTHFPLDSEAGQKEESTDNNA